MSKIYSASLLLTICAIQDFKTSLWAPVSSSVLYRKILTLWDCFEDVINSVVLGMLSFVVSIHPFITFLSTHYMEGSQYTEMKRHELDPQETYNLGLHRS